LSASVTPDEITIEVLAPEDVLADLDSSTLQVVVDATGLSEGIYSVQPSVIMPPQMQWVTAFPSEVTLTITESSDEASPDDAAANGTPVSSP
jgi:YbbR domain-containing protein